MAKTVIFEEQALAFAPDESVALYATPIDPPAYMLIEGETYTVVWDGVEYICECGTINVNSMNWEAIGNHALLGGEDTGEPFGIASVEVDGAPVFNAMMTADTADSHTVAIYQDAAETPSIILKDRDGNDLQYDGGLPVRLQLSDGRTKDFVAADSVAEEVAASVELDFSGGDMEVTPEEGKVFSKVAIPTPANLIPANIVKDVEVAGIVGTHEGTAASEADEILVKMTQGESYSLACDATYVKSDCLRGDYRLQKVSLPYASIVYSAAFSGCGGLTAVYLPAVTSIGSYAFYNCVKLQNITLPNVSSVPNNAFQSCASLTIASFQNATTIGNSAFYSCQKLQNIYAPKVTTIGSSAFAICSSLATADFPEATSVGSNAFSNCVKLSVVNLPKASTIGSYVFWFNTSLTAISLPALTSIANMAFARANNFKSLYLFGSSVPTLASSDAFSSTQLFYSTGSGSIFVRSSLQEAFQTATNWSYFSSRIVGLTDEEIAALEG